MVVTFDSFILLMAFCDGIAFLGTGFASGGGKVEAKKETVAFQ